MPSRSLKHLIDKLGKTSLTSVSAVNQRLKHPFRGTPQAQVHFADMSDYAFTIHVLLPLAAVPMACRMVATVLFFDPMLGQVSWETCTGD